LQQLLSAISARINEMKRLITNVHDFDFDIICCCNSAKNTTGRRKRKEYVDLICAFDIETSTDIIDGKYQAWLYIWQFQVDEICTIIGRTWDDAVYLINSLNAALGTRSIVVFVHNLFYEFQFMRSLFDIKPDDVFVVKSRRVLRWVQGNVEFRCSYLLSNMSLKHYTHKWHVKHEKLSGNDFNYKELRYPDDELSADKLQYCINDVLGLVEAVKAEMEFHGETLYSIPLTSTGYVRRDIKRVIYMDARYQVESIRPPLNVYKVLRYAFRGGNTHANRYVTADIYKNMICLENVQTIDRSSSYPDEIVNKPFPTDKFKHVDKPLTYDELVEHYIKKRGYAILTTILITDLRLKDPYYPCPYISLSNTLSEDGVLLDNGRVLSAAYVQLAVTDIDLQIITAMYVLNNDNVQVLDCYFASYGYLPDSLRSLAIDYYKQKTQLKGIEEMKLLYTKFKNLINSIYGCSAQDPGKRLLQYNQDAADPDDLYIEGGDELEDLLAHQKTALPYQWGVWVTAHARHDLQVAIDYIHNSKTAEFVYTDTDSVKYIGQVDIDNLNEPIIKKSTESGAYADDIKGIRHYMGAWEPEPAYDRFKTMGAKSYVYEIGGQLGITIAGVPKEEGAAELGRMGGMAAYKAGTIFHDGITETKYNDERIHKRIKHNGHTIELTSNMAIIDSFHKIGYSKDYGILLDQITDADIDHVLDFI